MVILLFPERTADLLGASDHLRPMVVDYLLWFMPSLVFELWIAMAMFALRLDGAPRLAMWCCIVAAAVNVVFDWLFIFHWHWGVKGAALATSVSCLIGALMAVGYLVLLAGSMRLHPLRVSWHGAVFFFHNIGVQCKIGSSALLGEATMAVLMFTGNHVFMSQWGDAGVGAFGVSCYYLPFVFMTGNAIAQSAQPIISYNFGMGNSGRIREALRVSLWAAAVCGAVSSAAFMLFPELLVSLCSSIPRTRLPSSPSPDFRITAPPSSSSSSTFRSSDIIRASRVSGAPRFLRCSGDSSSSYLASSSCRGSAARPACGRRFPPRRY